MPPRQKKENNKTIQFTSSYYSDLYNDSTLYAVLIRSPISSGTIRSITLTNIPEDYDIFTADDLQTEHNIQILNTNFPVLAKQKISYKGEPIGIITGPSLPKIHELVSTVEIVYTESFPQKKESETKDIIAKRKILHNGKKKSDNIAHTITSNYSLQLDIEEISESNGALCYANGKKLTIYTPTHWASNLRQNLAAITDYDSDDIIIHKTKLPITEKNAPWKNTTLAIQCAIASLLTKKSVLLNLSQTEQTIYDNFSNTIDIHHISKVDEHGKIIQSTIRILVDVGAYNPFAQVIADRLAISALGLYKAQEIDIEVNIKTSHNPPATPLIRWLDYHCFFAIESHMEEIAKKVRINSSEVREINKDSQDATYPLQLNSETYDQLVNIATKKSDFYRKYETYALTPYTANSKENYLPIRGIGLATAFEGNAFLGAITDKGLHSVEVTIEKNGLVILRVLHSSDTIATIWKNIASSILSVNTNDIIIDNTYFQNEDSNVPETMRNNMHITAQLLKKACLAVQKLRFHQALPITVKRTFNITSKKTWNDKTFSGKPFYVASWIALIAEVELIVPIYSYAIKSIWVSIDAGAVMDKRRARYAIQDCIKKILSQTMKNQMLSEPVISVTFIDSTEEPKQMRELIYSTLPAAICNALSQILQQPCQSFPIEPKTIYDKIQNIHDKTIVNQNEPIDKKHTEEKTHANEPTSK